MYDLHICFFPLARTRERHLHARANRPYTRARVWTMSSRSRSPFRAQMGHSRVRVYGPRAPVHASHFARNWAIDACAYMDIDTTGAVQTIYKVNYIVEDNSDIQFNHNCIIMQLKLISGKVDVINCNSCQSRVIYSLIESS